MHKEDKATGRKREGTHIKRRRQWTLACDVTFAASVGLDMACVDIVARALGVAHKFNPGVLKWQDVFVPVLPALLDT